MLSAERPARREGERVRAGHHELAVGEVDEPQHAEDEADPDRHQRVDGAEAESVESGLEVEGGEESSGEVGGDDLVGVVGVRGVERQPQLAVREHVRPVGERDRALRPLLDEQDRDAALADPAQRLEDAVDQRAAPGRATARRAAARRARRRARGRSRAAAAGRRRACPACRRRNSCSDRKEVVSVARAGRRRAAERAGEPEAEVLLDGEARRRSDGPPARARCPRGRSTPASARAASGRASRMSPAGAGTSAHDRVQRRRLAGAVRADQADDLAPVDAAARSPRTAGTVP